MRITLVFPPAADPAHPPMGIAALAGSLRPRGHEVHLDDLNLAATLHLLSQARVEEAAARLERRLETLDALEALPAAQLEEYALVAEHVLSADWIASAVDEAVAALRSEHTYADRATYRRAAGVVRRAMELISAAHYPLRWYQRGFSMSHRPTASAEVLAALEDREQNIFLPLLDRWAEELASGDAPDVVGLSVNYYAQVIPALTAAAAVRRHLPRARVVVGGGLVCFFDGRWEVLAPFAGLVDAWIPWEGERPLAGLLEALEGGRSPRQVPGVLVFEGGAPHLEPPPDPPDLDALPTPDFAGLPLDDYFAPEPILPLLASRGCYWGKCGFCSHATLYRGHFRRRDPQRVVEDIRRLAEAHGARLFYLVDEAIPPRTARALATALAGSGLDWFGEMRMERALDDEALAHLAGGGCRMLMFGLESGAARVLGHMDKGTTPEGVSAVLRACGRAGVRAFAMFMAGFPTETEAEARATFDLVEAHAADLVAVAFSNFILEQHAPVHADPGRYGITRILPWEDEDLKIYARYEVAEGMHAEAAMALLEEERERPWIRALVERDMVSRAHLALLPWPDPPSEPGAEPARPEVDAARLVPRRVPGLVARPLAFDLVEVKGAREGDDPAALARHPGHYVFDPARERLVEVGEHGFHLLRPCDGRFSLAEILDATGASNHEVVLGFYDRMTAAGLVRWEERS